MKTRKVVIAAMLGIVIISACSSFAPEPTQTPEPTPTATKPPTDTPTTTPTSTPTLRPTATPTEAPTSTPTLEISSTPITEWRGLPIMPGAYGVDDDGDMLTFHIDLSVNDVNAYYKNELPKVGWNLFTEGMTNTDNILNIYINGDQMMTIAIAKVAGSSDTIVIIVMM